MKRRLLVLLLAACIALTLLPATAMAASNARDGLTVTLTTSKKSYAAKDIIGIDASVTNNNSFTVRNARLDIKAPAELVLQSGATTGYMSLAPGRTASISALAALRSANPNIPQTGAPAGVWLGILAAAAGAGALLLVLRRKSRNAMLAALLCLALLGSFIAPVGAHAATVTRRISVSQPVTVGGKTYVLQAELTYDAVVSDDGGSSGSKTYSVTVNNGTGDGSYAPGATVTITADAPQAGKQFAGWTVVSGGVILADASSATTTFTMPNRAVVVTATYEDVTVGKHEVTVEGGTGSGEYEVGSTVNITANEPEPGMAFAGWEVVSGSVTIADVVNASTFFIMPDNPVVVRATYGQTYSVTVNGGSGSGKYLPGATVTVTAGAPSHGMTFAGWDVYPESVTLANASSATTTFTMPSSSVTLWAKYVLEMDFSSGASIEIKTGASYGSVHTAAVVGENGSVPVSGINTISSGEVTALAQTLPFYGSITSVDVKFKLSLATDDLLQSIAEIRAQLYIAPEGSDVFAPVPGTLMTLSTVLTGRLWPGSEFIGHLNPSIPIPEGSRMILVVAPVVVNGLPGEFGITGSVSATVTIAPNE